MKTTTRSFVFLLCIVFGQLFAQNAFFSSSPEEEGISSEAILSFVHRAEKEIDALHSLMILRHGKVITQGWWAPYSSESPHVMHSLSKSFTSTAIGLAVGEGKLSLDDQVISFFPELTPKEPSWQLNAMRIRDLITMNTGHIEEPIVWRGAGGDWVKHFLAAEVKLKPGTHFKYNSAATYMLSAILQKVTGEKLVDYLDKRLFRVLGIDKPHWDECPKGINVGGWGLRIKTEDIAKLGQLYLQKGMWKGERILTEDWVAMATDKQVSNGSNPNSDWEQGYGFQFWRCRYDNYRGDGAFGQFCIVIPEHEVVIAITSGVIDMGHVMKVIWEELLPKFQETPLPSNPQKWAKLQEKMKNLALNPIQGDKSVSISKALAKKSFVFEDNDVGLQAISFDLGKKEHAIRLETEDGEHVLPIGSGEYHKRESLKVLPYIQNLSSPIASSGAWISEDTYQLRCYLYHMPARITYTFTFSEKEVSCQSKLDHSLFGQIPQEDLKARAEE